MLPQQLRGWSLPTPMAAGHGALRFFCGKLGRPLAQPAQRPCRQTALHRPAHRTAARRICLPLRSHLAEISHRLFHHPLSVRVARPRTLAGERRERLGRGARWAFFSHGGPHDADDSRPLLGPPGSGRDGDGTPGERWRNFHQISHPGTLRQSTTTTSMFCRKVNSISQSTNR